MQDPTPPDLGHGRAEHCNPVYTWHGHVALIRHEPPSLLLEKELGEEGGCDNLLLRLRLLLIKFIETIMTSSFVSITILFHFNPSHIDMFSI